MYLIVPENKTATKRGGAGDQTPLNHVGSGLDLDHHNNKGHSPMGGEVASFSPTGRLLQSTADLVGDGEGPVDRATLRKFKEEILEAMQAIDDKLSGIKAMAVPRKGRQICLWLLIDIHLSFFE